MNYAIFFLSLKIIISQVQPSETWLADCTGLHYAQPSLNQTV